MAFGFLPAPANFVGRERELDLLTSHLTKETGGLALVHGPVGVGKTALVEAFAQRHLAHFSGGVQYLPSAGNALSSAAEAEHAAGIMIDHVAPQRPGLVVVEEVASADPGGAAAFVATIRQSRPGLGIVFTSQLELFMPGDWLDLPLQGLPDHEIERLLHEFDLREGDLPLLLSRVHGNPLLASTIAGLARRGEGLEQVLARLSPVTYSGLLGPDGRPLDPEGAPTAAIGNQIRAVRVDLISRIEQDPDQVYAMSSREFEELVAAIYEKHGFDVELTPASNDGGVDLYAVRYEPYGKVLTVVECKRNAAHRPVGVEIVRSLHGAVDDKGASVGVLATTSSFTAGAQEFQQRHAFRLALQDWFDLQDMLGR